MSALLAACGAPGLPPAGPAPGEVNVGYGTKDAGKVTGAVTSVSDKEVKSGGVSSVDEFLRGKVAGLQVTRTKTGVTYRIRGTSSLINDRPPLFVLDGIQLGDATVTSVLAGLTPNDIRQVDVLKDVASTSIYGIRGAGGVIIINTYR